jgi:serpin B
MIAAAVVALAGCEGPAGVRVQVVRELRSDVEREMRPIVPLDSSRALVEGNSAFAVDLYRSVAARPGNVFCSPYSVSLAMAMLYGGARGDTEQQIAEGMHFTLPQEDLHPAWNGLDLALQDPSAATGMSLEVVSSIWGANDLSIRDEYLDLLALDYGAGLGLLDFAGDPEGARATINAWVSDRTHGRIVDLLPATAVTDDTRFVLTNAIWFEGDWANPFEATETEDETFTRNDGSTVEVPMMSRLGGYAYAEGDDYQAIELPYEGRTASMVLVLPADLGALEQDLDAGALDAIVSSLEPAQVQLGVPRFSFESRFDLLNALGDLGMTDLDDLGGISSEPLLVDAAQHQAFVAVDEEGTEAAAATAIGGAGAAAPGDDPIREMRLDRPFLFFIRDVATGTILFLGRVVDPS